jgi:predicted ATP-grasp superfamily ATP-dependent carboligase
VRILVYEFASGGGLAGRHVPASVAREGAAMRSALVADLSALGSHEIVTTADAGVPHDLPPGVRVIALPDGDVARERALGAAIETVDAVWLIAPETGRCLERLASSVEQRRTTLVGSGAAAIWRAADKARLARRLAAANVRHPKTRAVGPAVNAARAAAAIGYPIVVKPARGAGSEGVCLVLDERGLSDAVESARQATGDGPILLQEYIRGAAASVSLLVDNRHAVPLSLNAQAIGPLPAFSYRGGETPFEHPLAAAALEVASRSCTALGGLRGFVGVDVVLTDSDVIVIEINPRLTTAYLGVRGAIDENLAALAIAACAGALPPPPRLRRSVRFTAAGRVVVGELNRAERGAA